MERDLTARAFAWEPQPDSHSVRCWRQDSTSSVL